MVKKQKKPTQRGGSSLGEGGQGSVRTMDELPEVVHGAPSVVSVSVDLLDSTKGMVYSETPTSETAKLVKAMVFKVALPGAVQEGDADAETRNEFDKTTALARSFAQRLNDNETIEQDIQTIERLSSLIITNNRYLVVGIRLLEPGEAADAVPGPASRQQHWFPMYRRMAGDLHKYYKTRQQTIEGDPLTMRTPIEAALAVLGMLEVMLKSDVHHCDIKEENVLYDVTTTKDGAKNVRFALTDFGLVKMSPSHVSIRGTPGSISPLMFDADPMSQDGRSRFAAENRVAESIATESEIWGSFDEFNKRSERTPFQAYQKNDLYSLGVMFSHISIADPAQKRQQHQLRDMTRRLILGELGKDEQGKSQEGAGAIWTIKAARAALEDWLEKEGALVDSRIAYSLPKA
jgi:serine/threonine protein kinase